MMKILLILSDHIIIFCDETINWLKKIALKQIPFKKKINKIPHPNYIGFYPVSRKNQSASSDVRIRFLFLGMIRRYKNIDLLIEVFQNIDLDPVLLTICGECPDSSYQTKLRELCKNSKNIILDLKRIEDSEIVSLVTGNDILILPYDINSSLNSGVIFLAFSFKRTVIAPLIGTLMEYQDDNFFYSYIYNSSFEHKTRLKAAILKAIADFNHNNNIFFEKGEIAYNLVRKNNSFDKLVRYFENLNWTTK